VGDSIPEKIATAINLDVDASLPTIYAHSHHTHSPLHIDNHHTQAHIHNKTHEAHGTPSSQKSPHKKPQTDRTRRSARLRYHEASISAGLTPADQKAPDAPDMNELYVWGDRQKEKSEHSMRIGLMNIHGFPLEKSTDKLSNIASFIDSHQLDVFGMTEINTHWKNLPSDLRMEARTVGWFQKHKFVTAYHEKWDTAVPLQFGGVSLWAMDDIVHRIDGTGIDESGLGRWVWQRLQGKGGVALRMVTAYCPVRSSYPGSVWTQHKNHFDETNRDGDPRDLFVKDICTAAETWMKQGDQVILMMDANTDVTKGKLVTALQDIGLSELITNRHGSAAPATYQRGSVPIDGVFVSSSLLQCQCGYTQGVSDHLSLWVDIPYTVALGHEPFKYAKLGARRLTCQDPRVVARYNEILAKHCEENKVFERAAFLASESTTPIAAAQAKEWEDIDRIMIAAMEIAEKGCRKIRAGKISWTPELSILRMREKAWSLKIKGRTGGGKSGFFSRVCRKAGITIDKKTTTAESIAALTQVKRELRTYKSQHESKRTSWLEAIAHAWAVREDNIRSRNGQPNDDDDQQLRIATQAANRYKHLISVEEQRKTARIIKAANNKLAQKQSIVSIIAAGPNNERITLTDQSSMQEALLAEGRMRGNQAADTPFLVEPLAPLVGPLGITQASDEILDGSFSIPPGTDEFAARLIQQLQAKTPNQMPQEFSVENFRRGWQRARESTASDPRSPHYGHYKAAVYDDRLIELHAHMAWVPYITGYSPHRWQQGVGVMIYKKPGNTNLEDMREIKLFTADNNMNNKRLGRELMWHAEAEQVIAPEQYGSRRSLSAIEHCLNKKLSFDILRQAKRPGALCSNDAKGCYDRIVHSVASLCLQRAGIPKAPIISMFTTLQKLRHYVRTAYGDSETFFLASDIHPVAFQGVGQGNGAGPQVWALVSSAILDMLRHIQQGAVFIAPLSKETVSFVGYSFVDDTDLLVTNTESMRSAQEVTRALQLSIREWEGGLRATGGALAPSKTFWYLIDFEWDKGEWSYTEVETGFDLRVRNPEGEECTIERVPVHEARRTLGVRLAPDGNNDVEFEYLLDQAAQWADNIRSNHLSRKYVWQSLTTTLLPKLHYPLLATTLSRDECEEIDRVIRKTAIPLSGTVRTFPLDLVHGAISHQGFGWVGMYDQQGIEGITALIKFAGNKTHMVGQQLRVSLELFRTELGMSGQIFQHKYKQFHHLVTASSVKHWWRYASENNIVITGPNGPDLRRQGDVFLMDNFSSTLHGEDLLQVNRCRLFVQALTLADITTIDGLNIMESAWEGRSSKNDPTWPRQGNPTKSAWRLWKRAIANCFCNIGEGMELPQRTPRLAIPLGAWQNLPITNWEYDPISGILFDTANQRTFTRDPGRQIRSAIGIFRETDGREKPSNTQPASVEVLQGGVRLLGVADRAQQGTTPNSDDEWWQTRLTSWPDDQAASVVDAIKKGTAVGVADGSFKNAWGTASVVIEGDDNPSETVQKQQLRVDVISPGHSSAQCSLRSELAGILALVRTTNTLCADHGINSGGMTVSCDNETAVRASNNSGAGCNPASTHYDLVCAV
jgi:hypothetical protein